MAVLKLALLGEQEHVFEPPLSYPLDMTQLCAPYPSCILTLQSASVCLSQLLFRQMKCPKAIPTANWVLSSFQASTYRFVVSMTFSHDFVHSVWSSNTILSSSSVSPLARMFPFPPLVRIFFCWSYAYTMTPD